MKKWLIATLPIIVVWVSALPARGQQAQAGPEGTQRSSMIQQPNIKPGEKLLGVIQWDPHAQQISWEAQKVVLDVSDPENPKIVSLGEKSNFVIDLETGIMSKRIGQSAKPTEFRRFSPQEQTDVKAFMTAVTRYCLGSNLWWDKNEGTPVDKEGKPLHESPSPRTPAPTPAIKYGSLSLAFLRPGASSTK